MIDSRQHACLRRAEHARQILGMNDRAHSWISASTGILFFNSCELLSTSTLMRYTSLTRSSFVWICLGVNSASEAMNEITPGYILFGNESVVRFTFCPSFTRP